MICVHCGQSIPDDSVFCQYCGKKPENRNVSEANKVFEPETISKESEIMETDSFIGLKSDNPVPAGGIEAEEEYISKLVTLDGKHIEWIRIGSFYSKKLSVMVDSYTGTDEEGRGYGPVYINMYASETMKKPIQGFCLSSEINSTYDPSTRILVYGMTGALKKINENKDSKGNKRKQENRTKITAKTHIKNQNKEEKKEKEQTKWNRGAFYRIAVCIVFGFFCLSLIVIYSSFAKKNKELNKSLEFTQGLLDYAQNENDILKSKENEMRENIYHLEGEIKNLKVKESNYDLIINELLSGNIGYASSHFYSSESVFVVSKNEKNRKFTLTAYWSYGGSVKVSYSSVGTKSARVDFDKDSWETSTKMTIVPLREGVTTVTFSNSIDSGMFKIIIIVV